MESKEIEKLAEIQKSFIEPAIESSFNCDVIIKIRDGTIVFAESIPSKRQKLLFSGVIFKT